MLPFLIALVVSLVLAAFVVLFVDWQAGPQLSREVVVHTRKPDDQTVRGVLVTRNRRWLKLQAARYMDGETEIRLDGEIVIPAENVAFVQVI